jgi:hypothetical protein
MSVSRMGLPAPVEGLPFPTRAPASCPQFQELFIAPPIDGVYTYFCEPDYSVLIRDCDCRNGRRVPRAVTATSPATEEERSRLTRLAEFLQELVQTGAAVEAAISRFLDENRDLINFVIAAGAAALIAIVGKDVITWGTTIIADFVLVPIIGTLMRIALAMQEFAR